MIHYYRHLTAEDRAAIMMMRATHSIRAIASHLDRASAVISPLSKALVNRFPRAEAFRKISPFGTGAEDPEDAFEHLAVVSSWTPHDLGRENNILDHASVRRKIRNQDVVGHEGLIELAMQLRVIWHAVVNHFI